ncbi:MAG: amidase family protein [Solirubrobacteraceae bacterium]
MTATAEVDLAFAGPAALAELVRGREVHPRELVELFLDRIAAIDPHCNAFRVTLAEQALQAADGGGFEGPLAGVPIAVKDNIPVAGQLATWGSRSPRPPATEDAEALRRLRAAGAIPIGITNVPELMIFPWTASDANGITRNPWDSERTPGGSSGGSAAAVAAGMAPAALGSDGGGSIRIPSASCGLVGMKPTRGRVSEQPDGGNWLGLSGYGALARTVRDSAVMLDAMHGVVARDPHAAPPFTGSYVEAAATPPPRLRVAISRRVPLPLRAPLSADQRVAWERTAVLLSDLGHEVQARDPDYGLAQIDFVQTWVRGIHEESLLVTDRSLLEDSTRQMADAGRYLVPERRRRRLLETRPATTARIMSLWSDYDILLTPALARSAIGAEGGYGRSAPVALDIAGRFAPFTSVFNLTGQPAVALPAGLGADGLPLSVQLVGRPGAEDVLYSLAAEIEAAAPWAHRRPPVAERV